MAGNVLNGFQLSVMGQETLEYLKVLLPLVSNFTTNFSASVAKKGETVEVPVPKSTEADNLDTGYADNATDVESESISVKMGGIIGKVYGFSDTEVSKYGDIRDLFIMPGVEAIVKRVVSDIFALITAANYSTGYTGATLTVDDVSDLCKALNEAGVGLNRFLILNSSFANMLRKDDSVKQAFAYGTAVSNGGIPQLVHGFKVSEYPTMPATGGLAGIAGGKSGLVVATRVPAVPPDFSGELEDVTDPDTGLTIQLRRWYSNDKGKAFLSMGIMHGVNTGIKGAVKRIVYQAPQG